MSLFGGLFSGIKRALTPPKAIRSALGGLGNIGGLLSFVPGMQGLGAILAATGALGKGGKMNLGDILKVVGSGAIPGFKFPTLGPGLKNKDGSFNFAKFQPSDWLGLMGTKEGQQVMGAMSAGGGMGGGIMPESATKLQTQLFGNLGKVFGEQWKTYAERDWAKYEQDLLANYMTGIDKDFDASFKNLAGADEAPGKEDTERGVAKGVLAFNKSKAIADVKTNLPRQVMSERFSYLNPMTQGLTGALAPMAYIDRSLYDRKMQDFTDASYFLGMPGFGAGAGSGSTGGTPGTNNASNSVVSGPPTMNVNIQKQLEKLRNMRLFFGGR